MLGSKKILKKFTLTLYSGKKAIPLSHRLAGWPLADQAEWPGNRGLPFATAQAFALQAFGPGTGSKFTRESTRYFHPPWFFC